MGIDAAGIWLPTGALTVFAMMQIVRQLVRKDNLEARIARVEERSRHVCITADSTCGSCGARIGTKLFALYPDESIFCYKVCNSRAMPCRQSSVLYNTFV